MDYIAVQQMMNNSKSYYFFQAKSGQSFKLNIVKMLYEFRHKKVNNIWKRIKIPAKMDGLM